MIERITYLRPDTPNASLGGSLLAVAEKAIGTNTGHVNRFVVESSGTNALAADVYTSLPATNGAGLGVWIIGANPVTLASGTNAIGSVSVSNFPGSQAVTGTFWQATQPVSAASLPLPTGAATSAKQPALGTAGSAAADVISVQGIASMTALKVDGSGVTQPVSGTFWQATQPVSGPLTNTELRASAITVNNGTNQVTLASGTNAIGKLAANDGVDIGDVTINNAGAIAVNNGTNQVTLAAGTNTIGTANVGTLPTLTKGTQGATGISVQALKDAGRDLTCYYMALPVISTNTDTLQSLTAYTGGGTVSATTTPAAVPAGKTFRIQAILSEYIAVASAGMNRFTLRVTSGTNTVTASSPGVFSWDVGQNTSGAGIEKGEPFSIPDGIEFPAGSKLGLTMQGFGPTGTSAAAAGLSKVSIIGYNY